MHNSPSPVVLGSLPPLLKLTNYPHRFPPSNDAQHMQAKLQYTGARLLAHLAHPLYQEHDREAHLGGLVDPLRPLLGNAVRGGLCLLGQAVGSRHNLRRDLLSRRHRSVARAVGKLLCVGGGLPATCQKQMSITCCN